MLIQRPGRYRTRDGRIAVIWSIDRRLHRARGRIPGDYDWTWWYTNGEHALYPVDDLVELLKEEPA